MGMRPVAAFARRLASHVMRPRVEPVAIWSDSVRGGAKRNPRLRRRYAAGSRSSRDRSSLARFRDMVPDEVRNLRLPGCPQSRPLRGVGRQFPYGLGQSIDIAFGNDCAHVASDEFTQARDVKSHSGGLDGESLSCDHSEGLISTRHCNEVGTGQPFEPVLRWNPPDEMHSIQDTKFQRQGFNGVTVRTVAGNDELLRYVVNDLREGLEEKVGTLLVDL